MRKLNETKRILTEWKKNVVLSEGPYDDEGLEDLGHEDYYDALSRAEAPEESFYYDEEDFGDYDIEADSDYDFAGHRGAMLTIEPNDSSVFGVIRKSDGSELTLRLPEYADESDHERSDVYVLEMNPNSDPEELRELIEDHDVRTVSDVDKSYDYDSDRDDDLYSVDEWLDISGL